MTLDQFLKSDGAPSPSEFAKAVGVSEVSLWRIRKGEQNITRATIRAIIEASGGQVTAASLVDAA
jgi:DNA-binding transcriptional regulator YdaS (Cro superfamily)